ncbi:signal transduction histidine kinase [Aspergillus transmontanensis]|uniref:Signal transduction histidine kinase n=1 Tax=Aspergillus transmontanensis TaxID=1034304 RepID=A0A5N6VP60_9EURO|nr:signal transduction histidine kinase [Aspergillus transmontanensis]
MAPTTTTKTQTVQTPPKTEGPATLDDMKDHIDQSTFEQILEMDDEPDDRDFSKGIVVGFFEQAESTFEKMEQALEKKDLKELSSLGHFLKGSSATLGLNKVRDACEEIQNYGAGKDKSGTNPIKEEDSLKKIGESLSTCRADYNVVEKFLRKFFGVENDSEKNVDK